MEQSNTWWIHDREQPTLKVKSNVYFAANVVLCKFNWSLLQGWPTQACYMASAYHRDTKTILTRKVLPVQDKHPASTWDKPIQ